MVLSPAHSTLKVVCNSHRKLLQHVKKRFEICDQREPDPRAGHSGGDWAPGPIPGPGPRAIPGPGPALGPGPRAHSPGPTASGPEPGSRAQSPGPGPSWARGSGPGHIGAHRGTGPQPGLGPARVRAHARARRPPGPSRPKGSGPGPPVKSGAPAQRCPKPLPRGQARAPGPAMAGPRGLMGPIGARAAGPRPGPRSQAKAVVQVPSWGGDGDGHGWTGGAVTARYLGTGARLEPLPLLARQKYLRRHDWGQSGHRLPRGLEICEAEVPRAPPQ